MALIYPDEYMDSHIVSLDLSQLRGFVVASAIGLNVMFDGDDHLVDPLVKVRSKVLEKVYWSVYGGRDGAPKPHEFFGRGAHIDSKGGPMAALERVKFVCQPLSEWLGEGTVTVAPFQSMPPRVRADLAYDMTVRDPVGAYAAGEPCQFVASMTRCPCGKDKCECGLDELNEYRRVRRLYWERFDLTLRSTPSPMSAAYSLKTLADKAYDVHMELAERYGTERFERASQVVPVKLSADGTVAISDIAASRLKRLEGAASAVHMVRVKLVARALQVMRGTNLCGASCVSDAEKIVTEI